MLRNNNDALNCSKILAYSIKRKKKLYNLLFLLDHKIATMYVTPHLFYENETAQNE